MLAFVDLQLPTAQDVAYLLWDVFGECVWFPLALLEIQHGNIVCGLAPIHIVLTCHASYDYQPVIVVVQTEP